MRPNAVRKCCPTHSSSSVSLWSHTCDFKRATEPPSLFFSLRMALDPLYMSDIIWSWMSLLLHTHTRMTNNTAQFRTPEPVSRTNVGLFSLLVQGISEELQYAFGIRRLEMGGRERDDGKWSGCPHSCIFHGQSMRNTSEWGIGYELQGSLKSVH